MGAALRESPVTWGLILLDVLLYLLSAACAGSLVAIDNRTLVLCGGLYGPAVLLGGEWWRLGSAMFLHGGLTHLLLNMVSLWIVGRMMEHYFGGVVTLAIYLTSGLMGFLVSLLAHPTAVAVGASGAIFGLFGALGGFAYFHRERLGAHYRRFVREFGAILGLNLLVGLLIPAVDMSAHLGGLLLGAVAGYLAVQSRIAFVLFLALSALMAWGIVQFWVLPRMTILYLPA